MSRVAAVLVCLVAALVPAPATSQSESESEPLDFATETDGEDPDRDPDRFERRRASGSYIDAESRFSLQGYVTGTFASFAEGFADLGFPPPGQLLVPRGPNSSFQYDWALFLGSRLNDRISFVAETHFVTKASGDFRPDIVATEALVTWTPLDDANALRVGMGLFWAPFAGVNDDFFSAVNRFSIVPFAARAFPLHYNERGVAVEGEFDLGGDVGLNYVATLGNGVQGFAIAQQTGLDQNADKTLMGRLGVLPFGAGLEVGLSAAAGTLRDEIDGARDEIDPLRYPAELSALGVDVRYERRGLAVRSYAIRSTEDLTGVAELERWGVLAEGAVRVARGLGGLGDLWLKVRYDRSSVDALTGRGLEDEVWNFGLDFVPAPRARLKIEGYLHREITGPDLDDDGVIVQFSASF